MIGSVYSQKFSEGSRNVLSASPPQSCPKLVMGGIDLDSVRDCNVGVSPGFVCNNIRCNNNYIDQRQKPVAETVCGKNYAWRNLPVCLKSKNFSVKKYKIL